MNGTPFSAHRKPKMAWESSNSHATFVRIIAENLSGILIIQAHNCLLMKHKKTPENATDATIIPPRKPS